ncbi:hypothetical protein D3C87_1409490 [compost metagenome]
MGDGQLLLLLGGQWSVQRQRNHAQQAIERRTDFVTHVGQEHRAGFGHVQRRAASQLQLLIGLAEAGVDCLELRRTRRDDVFQLAEVIGQAVFGIAALLDFGGDVFKLLVGNLHQDADFIVGVPGRTFQRRGFAATRISTTEFMDKPHQRLGQHHIEQRQQNARQDQAAGEAVKQGHFGPTQEAVAERIGVDIQLQGAKGFVGQLVEIEAVFELSLGTEQQVADHAITALQAGALDVGQHVAVVVGQSCADDRR